MRERRIAGALALSLLLAGTAAFPTDALREIGCTEEEAQAAIFDNLNRGSLVPPHCNKAYKAIPAGKRAALVRLLGNYVRHYVESDAFRARYLEEWERTKPAEPEMEKVATPEDQGNEFDKSVREAESQLNSPYLSPEQKETIRQSIESMKQMMNSQEYRDIARQGYEMQRQEAQRKFEQDRQTYRQDLADWEKRKDIRYLTRVRLQEFLDLSADIDFNARLETRGRLQVFADPAFEAKNSRWKICFRCGREAVEAARAYASAWLQDLGGK